MKKNTSLLSFFLLILSCQINEKKDNQKFHLSATIQPIQDSTMAYLFNTETGNAIDSAIVIKNKFELTSNQIEPSSGILYFINKNQIKYPTFMLLVDPRPIEVYVYIADLDLDHNGMTFFKKKQLLGSPLNHIEIDYKQKMYALLSKQIMAEKTTNQIEKTDSIRQFYLNKRNDLNRNFIFFEQPNNYFSLKLLVDNLNQFSIDSISNYYNQLDESLKKTKKGKFLAAKIAHTKFLAIGDYVKDIQGFDLNGEPVKLSDFKKNFVLLDFWYALCPPCREQNRKQFPSIYKKYPSLKLISFSVDVNHQLWKKASQQDSINWTNFSRLKGFNDEALIPYQIIGYPTTLLIDKKGVIIKKWYGYEHGQISAVLDSVFNNTIITK